MAMFPKPNQLTDIEARDPVISDISIDALIGKGLLILHREITNLAYSSSKGKLSPGEAKDLRDHLKTLFEIKDRELKDLSGLTDEQLASVLATIGKK